jgi:hypothetical protein
VTTGTGSETRTLQPGSYTIAPTSAVFEPVSFTVAEGKSTVVKVPAGTVDFQRPGEGLWTLSRGKNLVKTGTSSETWTLAPGMYQVASVSGDAFPPVEFAVAEGQRTIVKPR